MRRECREHFPRHLLQRKPLVSDPGMHHGKCVTHVPWCMSGSLTRGGGENVPGITGACAIHNITYLARGPFLVASLALSQRNKAQQTACIIHGVYHIFALNMCAVIRYYSCCDHLNLIIKYKSILVVFCLFCPEGTSHHLEQRRDTNLVDYISIKYTSVKHRSWFNHFLPNMRLQIQIQIPMFIGTTMWNMSYQYTQIQQEHTHTNAERRKNNNNCTGDSNIRVIIRWNYSIHEQCILPLVLGQLIIPISVYVYMYVYMYI